MCADQLTKYEKARVIGSRATQISDGAEPMVDVSGLMDPVEMAKKELAEGKLPMDVIRPLPNGKKVKISLYRA